MDPVKLVLPELFYITMNVTSTALKVLLNMVIMNVYLVINLVHIVTKPLPNVKFVHTDISCKLPKLYPELKLPIRENV